jgi:hypothetical protein
MLNANPCCPNSAWDYDPASSLVYWQPNQTIFERTDATTSIFFLDANLMGYLEPTLNPIFHTNPQDEGHMLDGLSILVYRQTRLVTILGCVEEYEICNPTVASSSSSSSSSRSCLPITPRIENYANISDALRLSPIQSATLVRLAAVLKDRNMARSPAHHLGSNSLLASKTFQGRNAVCVAAGRPVARGRSRPLVLHHARAPPAGLCELRQGPAGQFIYYQYTSSSSEVDDARPGPAHALSETARAKPR